MAVFPSPHRLELIIGLDARRLVIGTELVPTGEEKPKATGTGTIRTCGYPGASAGAGCSNCR
jgi:hypothetical protein